MNVKPNQHKVSSFDAKISGDNKFDSDKDNILVIVIATEYDFYFDYIQIINI